VSSYYVFHEDKIEQAIQEWLDEVETETATGSVRQLREQAVRMFLRSETLKRLEMRKD
jgi:hypothetical protein